MRRYSARSSAFARTRQPAAASGGSAGRPARPLEADAVLVGLNAQVDDLAEVHEHGAVRRLDLLPALAAVADRLAQAGQRVLRQPQREHLAALEPDGGTTDGTTHSGTSTGLTSSVRTPPAVFGCRNATCVPRMPVRGVSSISRRPASRAAASAAPTSSTW